MSRELCFSDTWIYYKILCCGIKVVVKYTTTETQNSYYAKTVTINYEDASSGTTPTTLSFDKDVTEAFDVVKGSESEFVAPKAVVKAGDTVVDAVVVGYESSNTDVATVDAEGNVTFVGVGTTTITASYAGDATYAAATSISYAINYKARVQPELPKFAFKQSSYEVDITQDKYDFAGELDYDNSLVDAYNIEWTVSGGDNKALIENGTMVFTQGLEATYTITATFKGNTTYAPCKATCELVVRNSTVDKTVEFVAGTDRGTQTKSGKSDEMFKNPVTISSVYAAFAAQSNNVYTYRMYANTTTTISTRMGKIKKIEFVYDKTTNSLSNLTLVAGETGKIKTKTAKSLIWEGSAKGVKFTNTSLAYATKIIVTLESVPLAKSYSLDQTSESNTLADYDNANVTINRAIGTSGWYTLCLPFALTESETKTYFGADVKIRTFDSMNGTIMNFKKATGMEAGKPYLVKVSAEFDGSATPFKGVQLKAAAPDPTIGADGYKMQGVYNKTMLYTDGTQLFLGDNNTFFKPSETENVINGFRVYFEVPTVNGVPMNLSAANIDGVETTLTRIDGEYLSSDTRVFNLQGQCLGTSLSSLPSGIYVQGGKKVVVK